MLSGPLQGRLLAMLGGIKGAKRCLELGTFTGYSALCLAESGADVITCEIDVRAANIAKRYFEQSKYSNHANLQHYQINQINNINQGDKPTKSNAIKNNKSIETNLEI